MFLYDLDFIISFTEDFLSLKEKISEISEYLYFDTINAFSKINAKDGIIQVHQSPIIYFPLFDDDLSDNKKNLSFLCAKKFFDNANNFIVGNKNINVFYPHISDLINNNEN